MFFLNITLWFCFCKLNEMLVPPAPNHGARNTLKYHNYSKKGNKNSLYQNSNPSLQVGINWFVIVYKTCGLKKEAFCRISLLN